MDSKRTRALDAYRHGKLDEAISLQRSVIASGDTRFPPTIRDFLQLGLFLHAARQVTEYITVLRDGLRLFPNAPELHENIAIGLIAEGNVVAAVDALQRAMALGSQSVNVLDALCNALNKLGRTEEAIRYGRQALEQKHARFGTARPMGTIPNEAPPPFNPQNPVENVISYALWGDNPRYLAPLMENLRIRNHLFPAWTIRVYLNHSVPETYRLQLQQAGAQIRIKEQAKGDPLPRNLLWRFEVIADPTVKRFLVRDADSLLSVKERVAVDAWLSSTKYFHIIRDFYTHTDLVLAGMWGGVSGILPPPQKLLENFKPWRLENDHIDQDLLTVTAWPTLMRSCLIHDSVFTGCLGSVPFPPYGDLPRNHHIGQNAFIHFTPSK